MAWDVAYPSQRFNLSFGTKQVLGGDIVAMSNTVLAMFVRFVLLAKLLYRPYCAQLGGSWDLVSMFRNTLT